MTAHAVVPVDLSDPERAAETSGLRPRQYQLLLMLRGLNAQHGANVSDLAEWLQVRHQTAVGLVDRMEARGLLRRDADPDDGRRVRVTLTTEGQLALPSIALQHRDELRSLAPTLVDALRELVGPTPVSTSALETETHSCLKLLPTFSFNA